MNDDGSVDDLLEVACLELQRMEKVATSIHGTISAILAKRSGLSKKNLELERKVLDLTEKNSELRRKNFELRQQSLKCHDEDESGLDRDSTIQENLNNQNSACDRKEAEFEVINVPKILKRKVNSSGKNQAKKSKFMHQEEDRSQTSVSGEASLIASQVGNEAHEVVLAQNNNVEIDVASQEVNDPISLAGFENDSYTKDHNNEEKGDCVDEESFAREVTNTKKHVNAGDNDIVVSKSTPYPNGHKFRTKGRKKTDLSISGAFESDRTVVKPKHQQIIEGSKKLNLKKVDLQTIEQMGGIVHMPMKVLNYDGHSNFSLNAIKTLLTANSANFCESLSCANMPEMEKGKILTVKDVYDPVTFKVHTEKSGFCQLKKGANKHKEFYGNSGWTQKLMRLNPDTFACIEVTQYCKPIIEQRGRKSDFKAKIFFTDQSRSKPYTMNSNDIYIHFMQRTKFLPHDEALTVAMKELVVINLFNAPDKMHVLNSGAYCYVVVPLHDKTIAYPLGKMMPHPTVHAKDCQQVCNMAA